MADTEHSVWQNGRASLAGPRVTELGAPGLIVPFPTPEPEQSGREPRDMSTIRVAKRSRFTAIDRRTIRDERLSFRARGVLVWLLDKPDDWSARADTIAAQGIEGRKAVLTALRELVDNGYLVRRKWQDELGRWHHESVLFERPQGDVSDTTTIPSPNVGEPACGNGPLLESPTNEEREEPPNPHASQEEKGEDWKPSERDLDAAARTIQSLRARHGFVKRTEDAA